jgi:hypothetical protein
MTRSDLIRVCVAFGLGVLVRPANCFADEDERESRLESALMEFRTLDDDKKQGSVATLQLGRYDEHGKLLELYAEGSTGANAYPEDQNYIGIVHLNLTDTPLYYRDRDKVRMSLTFSGVDNDTWKYDTRIRLNFRGKPQVHVCARNQLVSTTQIYKGYEISQLETC